ncbi:hypothetical protein [Variovorax sp. J31P207]|uniref:hypothetical protein n=1 Tax=Variovorax sp. J31P207 TaxID=3053510 RepID=UPI002576CB75|nr:hypothetical protein [Variovorax sp. J31P207]MDM0069628.1 hypothetical protein [Variovorax sp. J31P207]
MNTENGSPNGPDGLRRFHRMLAATYGAEIPAGDYHAVVLLLDDLSVSLRGIVELMSRFTPHPRGQLINDVNGVVGGEVPAVERDVSRVRQLLALHGYDELLREALPRWVSGSTLLDPLDPRVPSEQRRYWSALLQVFPNGLQTPKDYVTVLAVLRDEQLSSAWIETLVSALLSRPRELIARDIGRLGTVLNATEEDKALLKQQLSLGRTE